MSIASLTNVFLHKKSLSLFFISFPVGMKRVLKEDEAVSPIIATILLIAITVTIIASAYSIFAGYIPTTSPTSSTITIQYNNNTTDSGNLISGNYVMTLSETSSNVSLKFLDAEIVLQNGTVIEESMLVPYLEGHAVAVTPEITMNVSMPGAFLSYYGYIVLNLNHSSQYISTFSLVNVQSGNRIAEVNFQS